MISTNSESRGTSPMLPTFNSTNELTYQDFVVRQKGLRDTLRATLKSLFDYSRACDRKGIGSGIPELCTEGFDHEQIWTMVQMETDPLLKAAEKSMGRLENSEKSIVLVPEVEESSGQEESTDEENQSEAEENLESSEEELEADASESDDAQLGDRIKQIKDKPLEFKTELDDKFFSIAAMERYVDFVEKLEEEEAAEEEKAKEQFEKRKSRNALLDESDADSYDDSDEEKGLNEFDESDDEEGAAYTYDDFFGVSKKSNKAKKSKTVEDADDMEESEDDMEETENEESNAEDLTSNEIVSEANMSKFERNQLKLKQQIEQLEEEALGEKEWQLTGEVVGKSRPANSLLEQGNLDVDYLARNAPTITEETTETLEDVIRRRIIEQDFDDVERKRPMAQEADYRPKVELSMEKSKEGLGDVYAKDYEVSVLGHQTEQEKERTEEQKELDEMFRSFCHKLDALSNFHYTPKPPQPEATIKSSAPAIEMEEVTPMAVSAASMAAPQEVYKSKSKGRENALGKSKSEQDGDERQTIRRAKKAARKKRRKQKEADKKFVQRLNPGLGNKHAAEKVLNSLQPKNVTKGKNSLDSGKADVDWTKSGQFFKRLQEQTDLGDRKVSSKRTKVSGGANFRL